MAARLGTAFFTAFFAGDFTAGLAVGLAVGLDDDFPEVAAPDLAAAL